MNEILARVLFVLISPLMRVLHGTGLCSGPLALRGFESVRWRIGQLGAWTQFQFARRRVPAYAEFLSGANSAMYEPTGAWSETPAMDKRNYVNIFSLESRCVDGVLPTTGVMIDESSGSSGVATNWVRGVDERNANRHTIQLGLRRRLGKEPLFFINAFALGPWATGINLTLSLAPWCCIKTIGPDLSKIESTLRQFGPSHHYVIMGYPPFLKQIVDRIALDWSGYQVSMIYGGEGMSESMRRYLQERGITRVFGSYGASDLELNIAAETDFTIALRRLLESRPVLAETLLQHHGALPMIFQFNPADFFLETNAAGELLVTICRPNYVAPKIRYNIHDLGHVMRMPDLVAALKSAGVSAAELERADLDLPVLFHYGRSDASVSYYGCKIPPTDIQEAIFSQPALAECVDAFQVRTYDDADGDKRLVIALEVADGGLLEGSEYWTAPVFDALARVNQDFRESRRMVPDGKAPTIEVHKIGTGPFAGADIRIKRKYVATSDENINLLPHAQATCAAAAV
jgi:phenylacetate-CoA ligase